jgi:hypothetical protein
LARFEEKEGATRNQIYSVWRSKTSDLTLRLHQEVYLGLIYYSGEFHSDWRSPSTGPNYWVLIVFREGEILLEDSVFWRSSSWHFGLRLQEGFYLPRSIILQSLVPFGGFHQLGRNIGPSHPFRRAYLQPGGFGLDPDSYCIGLHLVFSLGRLISSYLEHFVEAHISARGSI